MKWEDVDWKNKCIHVNRSLRYDFLQGVKQLYFTSHKTINSYRKIPFMGGIEEYLLLQKEKVAILKEELGNRFRGQGEFEDLVFVTSMGSPVNRTIAESELHNDIHLQQDVLSRK